ncbi:amidohydrolase family protein [Thermanaerosceptrum fracticalcis]|uniref:5-methylthioadenosine/S-adenosylhomocysteine deaminase n=1 Tax=Thermanaerosceptrum fracticalcis TaxID=1712410 RepID=A0A7G6E1I4_THEFR|nr:amidohydrolase [Thermanaerosceptrum fracticalcis]QNB45938.1 amidohydrolase family protein [Thermanaerosceptrum fracticalcis]
MTGLLIKNALILPMNKETTWFQGDIYVEGNSIKEVGKELSPDTPNITILDGQDTVVLPGFVNCHTHAAMTLLRSYGDDMPLMVWLSQRIWPREAHLTEEDIYWGTMLSILEMIKSGTTCFADMYFYMDQVAQAVEETGIRASLSRGMIGLGDKAELALRESEEFVQKWHGKAQGRITCLLGPHAPYTCPPDYLKEVMALADKLGVGLHIHLAETRTEVEDIQKQYGMTPVKLMDSLGLFTGRHVLAAHCVHLTPEERAILIKHQVGIAHNPESNMKLASGVAPIPELVKEGARVGLGTDGAASNNNLDLLEEMRTCALLHKVTTQDPTVLPAYQVLEMATRNGAQVLGLEKVGLIAPGQKADLIMVDLHKPHLTPLHDPVANLVYAAQSSDVKNVIIDGKLVMKDRHMVTMDEERVIYEARKRGQDLVTRQ